jgi:hypothetical protein
LVVASCELFRGMEMTKSRSLAWDEESQQWSCSECAWVFQPSGLFQDRALNKHFDVVRRVDEFAAHVCADFKEDRKI